MARVFLLSPANCGGERAQLLLSSRAGFPLARQLRTAEGARLGDVMSFVSGLYFRGKLAYAEAFGIPLVITADAGLRPADTPITLASLRASARVDIDAANPRYRRPLEESARAVAALLKPDDSVTLLGSIASDKYVNVLLAIFGDRLTFPLDFVGRGDMSRGGLLLRCVRAGEELPYAPVAGAVRHGTRPPRLARVHHTPARAGGGGSGPGAAALWDPRVPSHLEQVRVGRVGDDAPAPRPPSLPGPARRRR